MTSLPTLIRVVLAIVFTAGICVPRAQDVVRFKNSDVLRGRLQTLASDSGLQWTRPDLKEPALFHFDQLNEVELTALPEPQLQDTELALVRLINLDDLHGKLISCDENQVVLAPWWGNVTNGPNTNAWQENRITIPRTNVLLIAPLGPPRTVLFDGPVGLEGWTRSKVQAMTDEAGDWHFKNNAFYATESASISRDLELPDLSSLQFDLEWRGFFNLAIALYTDYLHPVNLAAKDAEPGFGGFYSMQMNSFSANLLPVTRNDPLRYLGQIPVPGMSQKTSARVDIRSNKQKRTIALMIDGQLIKEWTDSEPFAGKGTAVRFVHQGRGSVKLSNIRVLEWDGYYEDRPTNTFGLTADVVKLRNGDRINGAVKTMAGGKLSVQGEGQSLDVPIGRVKQVDFASRSAATNQPVNLRAHFQSSGALTFGLKSWTPTNAVISHPLFGPAHLRPEAFGRLEFLKNSSPAKK